MAAPNPFEVTRGSLNRLLLVLERALSFGLEAEGNTALSIERELNEAIIIVKGMKAHVAPKEAKEDR